MGFSLELFFEEIQAIMAQDISDNEKLFLLKNNIEKAKRYAQECNMIAKDTLVFMPELVDLDRFYVFDTETTGFETDAEICQIGLIDSELNYIENALIKITNDMSQGAFDIHGFSKEFLEKRGQDFSPIWQKFCAAVKDQHLVAWNLGYDLRLLRQTCDAHGEDFGLFQPAGIHCAMKAYAEYHGIEKGRYKLIEATTDSNLEVLNHHDAIADCLMTLNVIIHTWKNPLEK